MCPLTGISPTCDQAAVQEWTCPHSCNNLHVYSNSPPPICHWSPPHPVRSAIMQSLWSELQFKSVLIWNKNGRTWWSHFDRTVVVEPGEEFCRVPISVRSFPVPIGPNQVWLVPEMLKTSTKRFINVKPYTKCRLYRLIFTQTNTTEQSGLCHKQLFFLL